jgi:hypothetical protein
MNRKSVPLLIDRRFRAHILGLTEIDRRELAKRLRDGDVLTSREREFPADLCENKVSRKRRRPPSADVALNKDEIAQEVLYSRALHPDRQAKAVNYVVGNSHGVSAKYVERILRELDPERRRNIEASAAAFAETLQK